MRFSKIIRERGAGSNTYRIRLLIHSIYTISLRPTPNFQIPYRFIFHFSMKVMKNNKWLAHASSLFITKDHSTRVCPSSRWSKVFWPCHLWPFAPSHVDTDTIYHITYRTHNYFIWLGLCTLKTSADPLGPGDTIWRQDCVNIFPGNGSLSTNALGPLREPTLTNHQQGLVEFTWWQFQWKCTRKTTHVHSRISYELIKRTWHLYCVTYHY